MLRIVFALIVVTVAVSGIRLKTYEPFEPASSHGIGFSEVKPKTVTSHLFPAEYDFRYTPGKQMSYGFSLTNGGPFTVTITGIRRSSLRMFEDFDVVYEPDPNVGGIRNGKKLPLVLRPHESRYLEVRYRFSDCGATRVQMSSSIAWNDETIQFRVLGLARSVEWPLSFGVAVEGSCLD